uniref:cytochrome c heme attachment protein n=1 Tax=Centrolepis aristata TaxID=357897 RepID=UPI001F13B1E4|nr:cytochrome c heme attachment protein [Centrolepis aristata]ULQ64512.1 cytochrome c heme attachment protein [Centrolepis aristata]
MIFVTLEHILTYISFSMISIVIAIQLIFYEMKLLKNSAEKGMIITFFCITGLLLCHWIYSGHVPLSNLYESLIFLSSIFYIIYIIAKRQNLNPKKDLSTITVPSIILTQGFATSGLLTKIQQSTRLVPALQSQWLMMHVTMMLLSYAALLCGSLLSVALIVILFRKKINPFLKIKSKKYLINIHPFFYYEIPDLNKKKILSKSISFTNYYTYHLSTRLDYWSYRIISLGFTFLTIGILCGAVWANEAWGSYWSWDPKETWAFITWSIFAIYLHIKTNSNWKTTNSAFVASIGFFLIWICYFGINLLGIGLHSYGLFT